MFQPGFRKRSVQSKFGKSVVFHLFFFFLPFLGEVQKKEGQSKDRPLSPSVKSLLTLTIALGEYVEQMTGLLDQVLQHGGRQVVSTGYEELRAFFTRVDQWISDASGERQIVPLNSLSKLLVRELDGSVEAIRKGRAEAILAYLKFGSAPEALVTSLQEWRGSERSGTVQRLLDEALNHVAT